MIPKIKKTNLTLKTQSGKYKASLSWDADTDQVISSLVGLMVAGGYSIESINNSMYNLSKDYLDTTNMKSENKTE